MKTKRRNPKSSKPKTASKNKFRHIRDAFGEVDIPKNKLWGKDTQRSLMYFSIGTETMPTEFIHTYALFKKCAAIANRKLGLMHAKKENLIVKVCNAIMNNQYNDEFPCHIWQTGSGTQSNMNVNEVVANICNKMLGKPLDAGQPINPNDDVNMSQSSNDSFITVMQIFIATQVSKKLIPNLEFMIKGFQQKQEEFKDIIKIGRTHYEDAVPITFGQEFSGYVAALQNCLNQIKHALIGNYKLASGGTAVGTGLNTVPQFGKELAKEVAKETGLPFITAPNKFVVMSLHNCVVEMSDAMKLLATNIMKIANDFRFMSSGPRTGIRELLIPQNEAGSSIMPGKVNPTQCEAAAMASIQVMANNFAITFSNSQGLLELCIYNPIMLYNINQSIGLLSDVCINFTKFCLLDTKVNLPVVKNYVENALTLATALNKHIGYDNATKIAMYAHQNNMSLKEANQHLKIISDADLEKYLQPKFMV